MIYKLLNNVYKFQDLLIDKLVNQLNMVLIYEMLVIVSLIIHLLFARNKMMLLFIRVNHKMNFGSY